MTAIEQALREPSEVRLIPFLVAGDPDPETTLDLLRLLDEEGVAVVELGVPYSDPLADGPVIQEAATRALSHGMNLSRVLALAKTARESGVRVPLVLFSYVNPLMQMGFERFAKAAREAGFDGVIVPDLPVEENEALRTACADHGLDVIPLVAPTSRERVRMIAEQAQGFVYCVSSLGTTGVRDGFSRDVDVFLDEVRRVSPVPTAIGFGISRPEHVRRFSRHADAVVVGSALVRLIAERREALQNSAKREQALAEIRAFVRELKTE
jgi:tryptophan synthase alpha chain